MNSIYVIVSPEAWAALLASQRDSIDRVTLKARLSVYNKFLLKHFDNAAIYEDAGNIREGLRRIQHERLDGFYLVKRIRKRRWWKFWSREADTLVRIEFLVLIHHPGVKR